jgi:hypothetical protein
MNPVLESIKFVIENSKQVKIKEENLKRFCSDFEISDSKFWLDAAPFHFERLNDKEELNLLFIFASICFSFWGRPKWKVEYKGSFYDGAWGLFVALRKAIEDKFPILNVEYLSEIPEKDLKEIFKGNIEIPMFKERLNILREIGEILIKKFDSNLENLIKKGEGEALKLLNVIVKNFPSFNDFAIYRGREVFFHKKAQLFIDDLYRRFKGEKYGKLKGIEKITALADYKIPMVLRKFGVLEYSPQLAEKVDNEILIPAGSEEEIEIRANTIWVVELMKNELRYKIPNITAIDIDSYLWLKGKEKSLQDKPHHLTRTIFY